MGRRLSPLIAGIGLLGALAWFGLGPRGQTSTSGPDTAPLAADVDARLRETLAGVQARADTLAQLPRLGLAVATDERTVRDLTTDELAFRTKPGEHIEIAQVARQNGQDGAVHSLLRLPDDKLPLAMASLGPHLMVADGRLQVVVYVSITPRDRADELRGALAVAQAPDLSSFGPRLDALGLTAKIEVAGKAAALTGGEAPAGAAGSPVPLATAAPEQTTLAFIGAPAGSSSRGARPIAGPLVLLLVALAGAAALRDRGEAAPLPAPVPLAPVAAVPSSRHAVRPVAEPPAAPTPTLGQPVTPRPAPATTPSAGVPAAPMPTLGRQLQSGPVPAATPSSGVRLPPARQPSVPPIPAPAPVERAGAGSGPTPSPDAFDDEPTQAPEPLRPPSVARKLTPAQHLPASGPHLPPPAPQVSAAATHLPPPAPRPARPRTASQPPRPATTLPSWLFEAVTGENERPTTPVRSTPPADDDTLGREYRALYAEFINMRRTCREPVDNLDADRFIAALRQQHDELCQKYPRKDIRFRLAFDNGKAAIRFVVA